MASISRRFVRRIEVFAREQKLAVVTFERRQREEEVARDHLSRSNKSHAVYLVGKAQENADRVVPAYGQSSRIRAG